MQQGDNRRPRVAAAKRYRFVGGFFPISHGFAVGMNKGGGRMCNLYNLTTTQRAILDWTRTMRDLSGHLPATYDVHPDYPAPIVRQGADGVREMANARWGVPTSSKVLFDATTARAKKRRAKGEEIDDEELKRMMAAEPDKGVTNIRKLESRHWMRWTGVEHLCLVLATSFSEYGKVRGPDGKMPLYWFAIDESCPLFVMAGLWTRWTGVRNAREGPVNIEIFGFLTSAPNGIIAPVHEKAMPLILTTDEMETWLHAPWGEANQPASPARPPAGHGKAAGEAGDRRSIAAMSAGTRIREKLPPDEEERLQEAADELIAAYGGDIMEVIKSP